MSSFPLPNNSSITSSPEDSRLNVEHSTLPFSLVETARGKEAAGSEPELQAILEQAMERTGATGAAIALRTEDAVCCRASTGAPAAEVGTRLNVGKGLTGLCFATGEILLCNETNTDRRVDPQLCKEIGVRSVLVLPIRQNAKVVGVLEVLSVNPDAFNEHDAAAISKLADQVLPLFSESARIPHRCLHQPPSNDTGGVRDPPTRLADAYVRPEQNNRPTTTDAAEACEWREHYIGSQLPDEPVNNPPTRLAHAFVRQEQNNRLTTTDAAEAREWREHYIGSQLPDEPVNNPSTRLAHAYVLQEQNNRLTTTDAAEAREWRGHYVGSQLPDDPVTVTSHEYPTGSRWSTTGLAAAVALAAIFGYGYHLNHSRVSTHVAILPIAAANHKPAIPDQQHVLSEQDKWTNGQPKASDSVLTANMQEAILAIKGAVQSTDLNRTVNQAKAGDSTAQYEMAVRYAEGEGVPQNYRDAMAWFAKAAANRNDNAQWKLGLGYIKGIGVPHDARKAAVWFKRAANHGHIRAQSALSDLYLSGRGVPRDYVRAYTWASIAAGLRGNDNDRLKVIGSRMTAIQIEDAHRRISIWWERQRRRAASPASSQRTARPDVSDK